MWHHMFVAQIPLAEKIMRTVLVYALVALLIRATGKRGLSGLNTLDVAVVFLLSNVVQNAIIGNDLSVWGGAVGAVTLVAVDWLLNRLAVRYPPVARLFDGQGTTVIRDGGVVPSAVRKLALRRSQLEHAVRIQNGDEISDVEQAVLEPSGQLVVSLRPAEQNATKGDVERLAAQLGRIEAVLAGRG